MQDLANASQEQVNEMWAGLGYYRRARLLLEGAKHIQSNMSGQMPLTASELQKIPGQAVANVLAVHLSTSCMCCTGRQSCEPGSVFLRCSILEPFVQLFA